MRRPVLLDSALMFCAALAGLILNLALVPLPEGAVRFWEGGETAFAVGIGGTALLVGAVPSYLIAARLVERIGRIDRVGVRHVLAVGFLQGIFFLYALGLLGAVSARITPSLGRFPRVWEMIYILANFAVALLVSCAVAAVVTAVVPFMRRHFGRRDPIA
jgi:hypothetical protein